MDGLESVAMSLMSIVDAASCVFSVVIMLGSSLRRPREVIEIVFPIRDDQIARETSDRRQERMGCDTPSGVAPGHQTPQNGPAFNSTSEVKKDYSRITRRLIRAMCTLPNSPPSTSLKLFVGVRCKGALDPQQFELVHDPHCSLKGSIAMVLHLRTASSAPKTSQISWLQQQIALSESACTLAGGSPSTSVDAGYRVGRSCFRLEKGLCDCAEDVNLYVSNIRVRGLSCANDLLL
jgi:hypothetical protein